MPGVSARFTAAPFLLTAAAQGGSNDLAPTRVDIEGSGSDARARQMLLGSLHDAQRLFSQDSKKGRRTALEPL